MSKVTRGLLEAVDVATLSDLGRVMFRLSVIGGLLLFVLPLGAQQRSPLPPPPPSQLPHFVSIYPDFQLTAVGDALIVTPPTVHQSDPAFMGVVKAIRQGDAAVINFEGTFATTSAYPVPDSGGTWLYADPARLKDLQWMGLNLFASANNHSMDYGVQGVLDTMKVFEQGGAVFAGIGKDLGEARAPGYLSTPHGRVAFFSITSTFSASTSAGQTTPDFRGRPGASVLHHETQYVVDAAAFDALKKMTENKQFALGPQGANSAQKLTLRFDTGGKPVTVTEGDATGVVTTPDPRDMAEITAEIRDAREQADYAVVYMHNHESAPGNIEVPSQFTVTFAHAVIDAGADVFAMSGPHLLRGIEIYKGKVIMYSLGDFIFENDLNSPQPSYLSELFGLGLDALPGAVFDQRSDYSTKEWPAEPKDWQTVVADVVFHNGKPAEIKLTPVELGYGEIRPDRGIPRLADVAMGTQILQRLQNLSAPFGTKIEIANGLGTIMIRDPGK